MTTQTQDVRLPVTKDPETGHNTSDKFDVGRNFANKLWNAVRFALQKLEVPPGAEASPAPDGTHEPGLADKWILSRLAATVRDTDAALVEYDFNRYAQGLYDFFWRDLCDWYIEAVKPTVADNPVQRRVLAVCIDASLRLMHPMMPFITERLWSALNTVAPIRETSGVSLHPSGLLIHATWPQIAPELINESTEAQFALVQRVVTAMRQVRTMHKTPPRQTVTFSAQTSPAIAAQLLEYKQLIETLANVETAEVGPHIDEPADAAVTQADDIKLYLHGLIDADAERTRVTKRLEELQKSIKALRGRLSNKSYTEKAPAHLVQETRDQLAAAEKEAASLNDQMAGLSPSTSKPT
jgi:valyl-tRNA synthetase